MIILTKPLVNGLKSLILEKYFCLDVQIEYWSDLFIIQIWIQIWPFSIRIRIRPKNIRIWTKCLVELPWAVQRCPPESRYLPWIDQSLILYLTFNYYTRSGFSQSHKALWRGFSTYLTFYLKWYQTVPFYTVRT